IETAMGCATSDAACQASGVPNIAPQAFLETALAGTGYCTGFANCTTAFATKQLANLQTQKVFNIWSALDQGGINGSFCNTVAGCVDGNGNPVAQGATYTSKGFNF